MRNRARELKMRGKNKTMASEDVPTILRFCGIGFLFGDATGEDTKVMNARSRAQFEEKRRAQMDREAEMRKFRIRRPTSEKLIEGVEVIENIKY